MLDGESMKQIVIGQYQEVVDRTVELVARLTTPQEGWVRTVRRALGMSGAQLARRMKDLAAILFGKHTLGRVRALLPRRLDI